MQYGKLTHYIVENGVYVYFRSYEGQKVMVLLNNNEKPVTVDLNRFAEDLQGFNKGKTVIMDKILNQLKTITLPAKSPTIVELMK